MGPWGDIFEKFWVKSLLLQSSRHTVSIYLVTKPSWDNLWRKMAKRTVEDSDLDLQHLFVICKINFWQKKRDNGGPWTYTIFVHVLKDPNVRFQTFLSSNFQGGHFNFRQKPIRICRSKVEAVGLEHNINRLAKQRTVCPTDSDETIKVTIPNCAWATSMSI